MHRRTFPNLYPLGFTSQRGERYVLVESKKLIAYVPLLLFTLDERQAKSMLVAAGISMPGNAWRELLNDVASLTDFPPRLIATGAGWNGDAYLFSDGTLFSGSDEEPAVAFTPDPDRCGLQGSLKDWISGIAEPVASQSLPMAAILMAFASPLVELIGRKENFGFELVGAGGTGKSLSQRLAASVSRNTDVPSFNATLAGLESEMEGCNGQLLALDESNSFYSNGPKGGAGTAMKTFAFRLGQGKATLRHRGPRIQRYFFVFLTSSNQPLASLAGAEHQASLRAAGDRLMTLNIAASRSYGVFDSVPPEFGSAEEFAQALDDAADANHGYAMRTFIQQLVAEVAEDRAALVARIRADIRVWRERAGVGLGSHGAYGRVGDAFGLLYAAGCLAKHYKVLPASWHCGAALKRVYRDFYTGPKPPRPIDDDLRDHLRQSDVWDIDRQGLRRMGPALFARTPAFLKRGRGGSLEARIPPVQAARYLPSLRERIGSSRSGVRLLREAGHSTVKRRVRRDRDDRVVVLRLPPGFI